jgi:hypothetical protein
MILRSYQAYLSKNKSKSFSKYSYFTDGCSLITVDCSSTSCSHCALIYSWTRMSNGFYRAVSIEEFQ